MGKIYNNLISTTAGFQYNSQQPLDDREVVQNYEDLATLVSSNVTYEGIEVFVVDDKKSYKLIDGSWKAMATEECVDQKVAAFVNSAPEALDTLNELAEALGNDPNFATTVTTQIGNKANKATTLEGYGITDAYTTDEVDEKISNIVESIPEGFEYLKEGAGDQSVVINDIENNKAFGGYTNAQGYDTKAGSMSYKVKSVDGNKIYLDTTEEEFNKIPDPTSNSVEFCLYLDHQFQGRILSCQIEAEMNTDSFTGEITQTITGYFVEIDRTFASGETGTTVKSSSYLVVIGNSTVGDSAVGTGAHAEGYSTRAQGIGTHTEGYNTVVYAKYGHAEGHSTVAGHAAHAEGQQTKAYGQQSHAEGIQTQALGIRSHAEGSSSIAIGGVSHAEGSGTISGQRCFNIESFDKDALTITVKDLNNTISQLAVGDTFSLSYSANKFPNAGTITAIDGTTITVSEIPSTFQLDPVWSNRFWVPTKPEAGDVAIGDNSHAEGLNTKATGVASHAEGQLTIGGGDNSHAEGNSTQALGVNAHAEGKGTKAIGYQAHTEGNSTIAPMHTYNQHVQGRFNIPMDTNYAHVVGNGTNEDVYDESGNLVTQNRSNAHTLDWSGNAWFAGNVTIGSEEKKLATEEKVNTLETKVGSQITAIGAVRKGTKDTSVTLNSSSNVASGALSTAEGNGTTAGGESSHAEGKATIASGNQSHAEGSGTQATNWNTHAEGVRSIASGEYSHAEGTDTTSEGRSSHSEGEGTHAKASYAHSEGSGTTASGTASHSEGSQSTASGAFSHAEGNTTIASGEGSHAEGKQTQALGYQSHAEGNNTIASEGTWNQHVQGRFNTPMDNNYAHVVGNGTSESDRRNAHTLDWNGNAWFAGNVKVGNGKTLATEEYVGLHTKQTLVQTSTKIGYNSDDILLCNKKYYYKEPVDSAYISNDTLQGSGENGEAQCGDEWEITFRPNEGFSLSVDMWMELDKVLPGFYQYSWYTWYIKFVGDRYLASCKAYQYNSAE